MYYDMNVYNTVLDLQIFYHNARINHSGERKKRAIGLKKRIKKKELKKKKKK